MIARVTINVGLLRPLLSLAVMAGLLAGCATFMPSDSGPAISLPDPPKRANQVEPVQREHQRILAAYGGAYRNPRLQALLQSTVEKLVAASDRPDLRYRVTILNSPAINAFALPSGYLYVTRGLLALANDTAEVASVLSHEMAHVTAQHAVTREAQAKQASLVNRVATDVLSDPQTGAQAMARSKLALASFSRSQELEADAMGVRTAAKAGYDPYGATRFLTAMGRNAELKVAKEDGRKPVDFLASHPSTPERVKSVTSAARQLSAPGTGSRDRQAFLAATDGMTFGDDPGDGYVRGRRFIHPKLGITFTAPPDFALDNTAQAVLGMREGGAQALRLDVVQANEGQSLTEYLTSGWIENVEPKTVEEFDANGSPGATAIAKGQDWTFRVYVIRSGSDLYRFVFAAKNRAADVEKVFRESVLTFRRLSNEEIAQARPLRLQVVTVQSGDTAERFAGRMATDRPLDRFRVINGLDAGAALTVGEPVKIVVE
ncbi:TPR repeat-containing protein YfgC precursor [Variibacter gotjawalensis]|uniref:TPR repeat-containing protein YfgC n=1 Tax=Variibacter gotjawalensis TaxID=1333996 RepID=A0A0S3PP16_9BRAD|nr:putative Zn-dependent protease [Variibacter gotjawalensis]BAT57661.1 TPR repeat-containing protein YfgC precursor [Variibacter gotjawalensis]